MDILTIIALCVTALIVLVIQRTAVIIPQQQVYVIERLGKFNRVIGAGFHIILPFLEVIRYRHSLKESPLDTKRQSCITKDNVHVSLQFLLSFHLSSF